MICHRCNKNEIQMRRRPLCKPCYKEARIAGELKNYPLMDFISFKTRLIKRYGDDILNDFNSLFNLETTTLSAIANKYNFSREYARQVFNKINGFKYTGLKNKRTEIHFREKEKLIIEKRDPRNKVASYHGGENSNILKAITAEKKVFDICVALGYELRPYHSKAIDIVINGFKCEVKSSYTSVFTSRGQKTGSHHFALSNSQNGVDFVICYIAPNNKFFIIPRSVVPCGNSIFICAKKLATWKNSKRVNVSKYYEFEEAWHLLIPKQEVVFSEARNKQGDHHDHI